MNKYTFKDIKNVFVTGDCHGEFKLFFNNIKSQITIKDEDRDEEHPMEVERQARKRAKEEAAIARRINRPIRGRMMNPFGREPREPETFTLSDRFRSEFEMSIKKIHKGYGFGNPYSNSVIFVAGDCGFGFNKEKYYTDLLEKYNKILEYNNIYLIFVRGNHDDPSYFDGERVNFSNIKAVPDYSIVEANGKVILCVGGAISTDRVWRKEQEKRINRFKSTNPKTLYWANEAPILDKTKMDEIFGEYDKIDYVISHTAPSFVDPMEHTGLQEWEDNDKDLRTDVVNERVTMDRIFEYLRDNNRKPIYWAYGHFDMTLIDKRSGTWFRALSDGFNPVNIDNDVCFITATKNDNKKSSKKVKFKKAVREDDDPWIADEMVVERGEPIQDGLFDNRAIQLEEVEAPQHLDEVIPNEQIEEFPVNDEAAGDEQNVHDEEGIAIDAETAPGVNTLNDRNGVFTFNNEQLYQPVYNGQPAYGAYTTAAAMEDFFRHQVRETLDRINNNNYGDGMVDVGNG